MYTIISGTNRADSNTIKIARQYDYFLRQKGIEPNFLSLENMDVNHRSPAMIQLEKTILIPAKKFIFIAPEYNGSIPGVLKSLIDISDIKNVWWGKKALLAGVSTGRAGNLRGMEHFTGILHYVKVIVHPNKLPISIVDRLLDAEGKITDPATVKVINQQLDEFIEF
ncbi:NADPH-dependent FMN reductase [Pinibacter soli]|uniref:NADPH-dependent FMN reductase n=1 Tax=Pinibacter soli TaxID=3044211 RepID=A0ABT6RHP4_9BACT|nr:NADPH-dependent FMN reductase [Pinibacter soli]MDI3322085.1 NADPH-dependent FMN reductase [Pinibacter soli]